MTEASSPQKMPPKKALATLRQIVKGQPLARRNPNDPGHKAMDDAEDALDVLRSSVEQLEAAQEALRHIAYDGPNPGSRRSPELQWAADAARAVLTSNPASSPTKGDSPYVPRASNQDTREDT